MATGLADEIPDLAGVQDLYGICVHYCLYASLEYVGKPIAAYCRKDKGAELALMMKHWVDDVVVCSDGTEVSAAAAKRLEQHGIPWRTEPIRALRAQRSSFIDRV